MVFVEFPNFTRIITELLTDDEYRAMQQEILQRPEAGVVVPGSGGIRKLRFGLGGRGKRGGMRVLYYYAVSVQQIVMLYAFTKNDRRDLSRDQYKKLHEAIGKEWPK